MYKYFVELLSFVYLVVVFGISGVSGVSRLALYSSAVLFFMIMLRIKNLKIQPWIYLFIFFYAYIAIPSLILDVVPYNGLSTMFVVFIGTLSIIIFLNNKFISYNVIVYALIFSAIINIVSIYMGIDTAIVSDKGRFSGLMGNPNSLCVRIGFASFLIWLFPDRFNFFIKYFGIFLMSYGVYITSSRKGILLLLALFLMVILDYMDRLSKTKILIYLTSIVSFFALFYELIIQYALTYSADIEVINRVERAVAGHDKSYNDRIMLIKKGLELWSESPFFGHGFSQFANLTGFGVYAHNNFIELAVSGGIVGLLLFYSVHLVIICNSVKNNFILMLRLMIFVCAILLIDMAMVSFYDKAIMSVLGILLVVSSSSYTFNDANKHEIS